MCIRDRYHDVDPLSGYLRSAQNRPFSTKQMSELSSVCFYRTCPFLQGFASIFFDIKINIKVLQKNEFFGILGKDVASNRILEKLGESCPVVKMSCSASLAIRCVGNPWKKARAVPFKRTSDLPALRELDRYDE